MQIKLRGIAINVCSVYLKPAVSTVIAEQVLAPLRLLADSGKPLLLLGDFNAHHPQLGETKSMGKSNSVGRLIVDLAEELSLTILNTRDAWGTPTRCDSVLDLALTNNPDMFSLRIDAMPFLSDHSSLTIFFHPSDAEEQPQAPASSPLPPRWDVNKADWSTYHNVSKHVLQPLKDELDGMVDSFNNGVNGAQSTINAMATALSRSLNSCALAAIPKTKPREMLISDQQRHVNELLKVAQRKERTLANARRKVKRTHRLPRTPAIDRVLLRQSHSLNQARASYAAAVKAFRQASDRVTQASWDACCSRIESAPPGKAFREFKKTIAANRRKLACVTQRVDDELPSSTVESLNNFGSYYASVFSTGPLPDWNATGPPAPPSIPTDRNDLDHLVHVVANGDHHLSPCELDGNISISDVEHAMSSVRAGTAPGPDGLHVPFITKAAPIIKEVLRIIFQFSFDHGVVPVGWKPMPSPSSKRVTSVTLPPIASFPSPALSFVCLNAYGTIVLLTF